MKLKATPLYILSFLFLMLLIHEVHDWAHTLVAASVCPCWGKRIFDGWDFCTGCAVTSGMRALATVAGPIINYVLMWVGWRLMDPENPLDRQSWGCSLIFASLPLNNLLAAAGGGGDIINAIRWMQQHGVATNRQFVSVLGLLIVLALTLPPLVRAFITLPGLQGKLLLFPILLLVPGWLDRLVMKGLNNWLITPDMSQEQIYHRVIGWLIFLLVGWLLTLRWLEDLMSELSF